MIKREKSKIKGDITLTPLIDVVFILLIFFMVTMSLFKINTIPLSMPKSADAINKKDDKDVKVLVVKDNHITIGKTKFSDVNEVANYIKNNLSKKIVWGIQPAKNITVEKYLYVWKKLTDKGYKINIITPKAKKK